MAEAIAEIELAVLRALGLGDEPDEDEPGIGAIGQPLTGASLHMDFPASIFPRPFARFLRRMRDHCVVEHPRRIADIRCILAHCDLMQLRNLTAARVVIAHGIQSIRLRSQRQALLLQPDN